MGRDRRGAAGNRRVHFARRPSLTSFRPYPATNPATDQRAKALIEVNCDKCRRNAGIIAGQWPTYVQ
jgi:hypothetical protein